MLLSESTWLITVFSEAETFCCVILSDEVFGVPCEETALKSKVLWSCVDMSSII